MTVACISAIGKVIRGVSWDKHDASDMPRVDYLPILRAGNIGNDLNTKSDLVWVPASNVSAEQKIRTGDIAICMSSGSPAVVGKTASAKMDWPGSVGAFCALVRSNPEKCLPEYLAFYLKSARFRKWTSEAQGANIKNIKKSALEDFDVPVPSLDEQRRIVDLLSRAEGIVRLRREAEQKAAELIPALFIDMFGDPATNPKGWPSAAIGDLFEVKGGKRLSKGARYSEEPTAHRYIRATDIKADRVNEHNLVFLFPEVQKLISRYVVARGDVVITIAGTIGVAAPIGPSLTGVNLTENAAMIRAKNQETTNATFLSSLMNSGFVQHQIEALTGRVTIGKLALERIRLIEIRIPPLSLQKEFEERLVAIRSVQVQQSAATAKAQAAFDALLAQAFA